MKKILCGCLAALAVLLLCSCVAMGDGEYKSALDDAWEAGYSAANEDWEERVADIQSDSRRDGLNVGYQEGYNEGYRDGRNDGWGDGYSSGEEAGTRWTVEDVRWYADLLFMTQEEMKDAYDAGILTVDDIISLYARARDKFLNYDKGW